MGRPYSMQYGFGKINGGPIVANAKNHTLVGPQAIVQMKDTTLNKQIALEVTKEFLVDAEQLGSSGLKTLEHVQVTATLSHWRRSDVEVLLVSPNNITSTLVSPRPGDYSDRGFRNFDLIPSSTGKALRKRVLKYRGEPALGTWKDVARDAVDDVEEIGLRAILKLYGSK